MHAGDARSLIGALALLVGSASASPGSPARADTSDPAQFAPALLARMAIVGHPTAHIRIGTQILVTGKIHNGDRYQHDIYLAATLLDAGHRVIGRASGLVDNVHAGGTAQFQLVGAVTAPRWSTVKVKVTRVTEHVAGEGAD